MFFLWQILPTAAAEQGLVHLIPELIIRGSVGNEKRKPKGRPYPPSSLMAAGTFFFKLKKSSFSLMAGPLPPPL